MLETDAVKSPKNYRPWQVTFSLCASSATLACSVGLVALTSTIVGAVTPPGEFNSLWKAHLYGLIAGGVLFAIFSIVALWVVVVQRSKRTPHVAIFSLNAIALLLCLYFVAFFAYVYTEDEIFQENELFNSTKHEIKEKSSEMNSQMWVPLWLEQIQSKSKSCCGVLTFRDWEKFWPTMETVVPKSCCRSPENCVTDLVDIPFPNTPSDFLKTDRGCYQEAQQRMKCDVSANLVYMVAMAIVFTISQSAYGLQLCHVWRAKNTVGESGGGDNDLHKRQELLSSHFCKWWLMICRTKRKKSDVGGLNSSISNKNDDDNGKEPLDASPTLDGSVTHSVSFEDYSGFQQSPSMIGIPPGETMGYSQNFPMPANYVPPPANMLLIQEEQVTLPAGSPPVFRSPSGSSTGMQINGASIIKSRSGPNLQMPPQDSRRPGPNGMQVDEVYLVDDEGPFGFPKSEIQGSGSRNLSPTRSENEDEVGDRLAPAIRSARKKKKDKRKER